MTTAQVVTACGSVVAIGTAVAYLKNFVVWAYRQTRRVEATFDFVETMNTNHLPHIYHVLELLCKHQNIEVTEPQPHIGRTEV